MFSSFSKLFDFILGFIKYLHPLVDDGLGKSSDEIDHRKVEYRSGDHEHIEFLAVQELVYQFICHSCIVSELAERDEFFPSGHRMEHDDGAHYQSKIERTRIMNTVEEKTAHHEDRI